MYRREDINVSKLLTRPLSLSVSWGKRGATEALTRSLTVMLAQAAKGSEDQGPRQGRGLPLFCCSSRVLSARGQKFMLLRFMLCLGECTLVLRSLLTSATDEFRALDFAPARIMF